VSEVLKKRHSRKLDGEEIAQGPQFRVGHRHGLENSDLILWLEREATEPFEITLTPR